ncbi:MAG: 6-pyruvoyl-tetrahydropterin synthase-related protein [Candidatus Levyibacteriota bacterium]
MNKKTLLILFLVFVISLPAIVFLLQKGFFLTDDGEWMVIRFSAFHQALRDGQFPVRFLGRLNYGYGYPVANFLYPGFMYMAEIPKILGFGFVNSIKIILGLSMVTSAIFTYLWLSKLFNRISAIIGSLFYLYTPYHLFDLYKRGSIGEILAFSIIPFILWQIERKSLFWIAIGISFLILSHNTLALLFVPVIFLYCFLGKLFSIRHTLFAILIGLGLSSFFIIPVFFELSYTQFSNIQISNFKNYFAPFELIGVSTIFILIFASLSIFDILQKKNWIKQNINKLFFLMAFVALLSIVLSTKASLILWNFIPASLVQFPFRFLSYLPVSLAFIAGFVAFHFKGKKQIIVCSILLVSLIFSAYLFLKPSQVFDKGEGFYATNEATTTVQDEYMPKWVKSKPAKHFDQKVEIIKGKGNINDIVYNSKNVGFNIQSTENTKVRINTIYYPGWKAFINGKESAIEYNNDFGVMDLSIPKGEHKIEFNFSETPLRLFADIISILSLLTLFLVTKIYKSKF